MSIAKRKLWQRVLQNTFLKKYKLLWKRGGHGPSAPYIPLPLMLFQDLISPSQTYSYLWVFRGHLTSFLSIRRSIWTFFQALAVKVSSLMWRISSHLKWYECIFTSCHGTSKMCSIQYVATELKDTKTHWPIRDPELHRVVGLVK